MFSNGAVYICRKITWLYQGAQGESGKKVILCVCSSTNVDKSLFVTAGFLDDSLAIISSNVRLMMLISIDVDVAKN